MQMKTGDSPMALTVLTSLVEAYMKSVDAKEAARSMAALDAEFNLVEVVVSSVEVRNASPPSCSGLASRQTAYPVLDS